MNTLAGQNVAIIYSPFLYMENIESTVKSRHILPRGTSESFVALTPGRGRSNPQRFSYVQRAGALTRKNRKSKGVYAKKQTKEVFL